MEAYRELKTETRQPEPPPQSDKPVHGDFVTSVTMLAGIALATLPDLKEAYKYYAPKVADYIADKVTEGPESRRPIIDGVPRADPPITERQAAIPTQRGEAGPVQETSIEYKVQSGVEYKTPVEPTKVVDGKEQARFDVQMGGMLSAFEDKKQDLIKSLKDVQAAFDVKHEKDDPDKKKELQAKLDDQFKALHEKLEKEVLKEFTRMREQEPPDLRSH